MLLSFCIVALCIVFQRFILGKISQEKLEFSGNALINDKQIWILITGSLIHATLGHEVNNLLFTFVVSYVAETQYLLSPIWIIIVFTLSGIIGWLFSLLYHYSQHGQLAFFIPVRGISPNMYGFAFFCCIVYSNQILKNVLFIHPIIWMLFIIGLPVYCTNNKKHNPFIWTLLWFIICCITMLLYNHTSLLKQMTMGSFLSLYFIKCFISYAYFVKFLGNPSSADHACHLGGSVGGIILGIYYLYIHNKPWPYYRLDVNIWNATTRWDFIFPFAMLWVRLLNNM